jgi:hypothetical protein
VGDTLALLDEVVVRVRVEGDAERVRDGSGRAVGTRLSTRTSKAVSVASRSPSPPRYRSVAVTAVTVGSTAAGASASGPVCTLDRRVCSLPAGNGVAVAVTRTSVTGRTSAGAP